MSGLAIDVRCDPFTVAFASSHPNEGAQWQRQPVPATDMATYRFRIDAWTPETIPLNRLVEYLEQLALLFGNESSVHFRRLEKGSAVSVIDVDCEALPKVQARLFEAKRKDAPRELHRVRSQINRMLRDDNASGELKSGRSNVIEFPGRKENFSQELTVTEAGEIEGVVLRIGGKDQTAHALLDLQDGADNLARIVMTRTVARQMAVHLYGEPIRVFGRGKWTRDGRLGWSLLEFQAERIEKITHGSLSEALLSLSTLPGNEWSRLDNAEDALKAIRGVE